MWWPFRSTPEPEKEAAPVPDDKMMPGDSRTFSMAPAAKMVSRWTRQATPSAWSSAGWCGSSTPFAPTLFGWIIGSKPRKAP